MTGTLIMLNGTSSSGKSTLLGLLQARLEEPYLNAGIDKFIWMLPSRYLDRPLWDEVLGLATEAGPQGHALFSGMHQAVAALLQTGNNVVADHVLVEPRWVRECAALFAELPAYLVGLHCPLEVLEARELQRRDRTLGQARAQYELVHAHALYDLEIDTSRSDPESAAQTIIDFIHSGTPPQAFRRLREQVRNTR